jgi:hypothetical protein
MDRFLSDRLALLHMRFSDVLEFIPMNKFDMDGDPNGHSQLDPANVGKVYTYKWKPRPGYAQLSQMPLERKQDTLENIIWTRGWYAGNVESMFTTIVDGALPVVPGACCQNDAVAIVPDEGRHQIGPHARWTPIFDDGTFVQIVWEVRAGVGKAEGHSSHYEHSPCWVQGRHIKLWALHLKIEHYLDMTQEAEFTKSWDAQLDVRPPLEPHNDPSLMGQCAM